MVMAFSASMPDRRSPVPMGKVFVPEALRVTGAAELGGGPYLAWFSGLEESETTRDFRGWLAARLF